MREQKSELLFVVLMEFDLTHSILSSIAPQGLRRTFELVGTKMIRLDAARMRAAPDQQQQNKSKGACRSVALPRAFACEERGASFSMAVLGDLHLPPEDAVPEDFLKARDQLRRDMVASAPGAAHRVVQLGDLGAYDKGFPGSAACFRMAKSFIDSFEIPARLILGNHDLEDAALDSDAENLAAWREAFGQSHYWSSKIGNVTFVGLSTVRFRSNEHSVHEVHIDDEQIAFFERVLGDAGRDGSPVVVFTHAPILGSGLKAVQAVHVKNRCAWVNHSSNADHFISLVRRNPNVKLWFSGHFHLSQSYPDSISVVGGTAFVLTGVIGGSMSRDGDRHSRVLRGDESGFEVLTMDHETGESRVDLKGSWDARDTPRILTPPEELICDISSGFLCSEVDCSVGGSIDEGLLGLLDLEAGPQLAGRANDLEVGEFPVRRDGAPEPVLFHLPSPRCRRASVVVDKLDQDGGPGLQPADDPLDVFHVAWRQAFKLRHDHDLLLASLLLGRPNHIERDAHPAREPAGRRPAGHRRRRRRRRPKLRCTPQGLHAHDLERVDDGPGERTGGRVSERAGGRAGERAGGLGRSQGPPKPYT